MTSEQLIIRDNVSDFSDDENNAIFMNMVNQAIKFVNGIKQFHFMHSFNFDVVENESDKYVGESIVQQNTQKVGVEELNGIHTCTNSLISQDHVRLDSSIIAHNIVHLVKTNPNIEIKTLIADMHQRFGYTISYKKAWTTKPKALEMTFGSWEQSYNYLPVWLTTALHFVLGTIVKYKTSSSMEEGDNDSPRAFNPCIEGLKYCKPLPQVDETFLTDKYRGTLLTAIGQDGSRNNFLLAFTIHYLRRYVTLQSNLCIILDRRTSLLVALQSECVGWNGPNVSSVYCIRHIASNFNKQFKNVDLKKEVINMEYEMRKPRFEAKFLAIFHKQQIGWIKFLKVNGLKPTMKENGMKGAQALPITILLNETFNKINDSFVTNDIKIMNMIKA
ncbi:hypothetical protein HKD37_15G043629 [Glycine soja]